MKNKKF